MNVATLVATPPGVVMVILLVIAAVGTVAVTCVAELTTKLAVTSPNVTFVVCVTPLPLMTTFVPTGPLVGLKLDMLGMTLKILLLTRIPVGVVTLTAPVVPVAGTIAVMYVFEATVKLADPEPNFTLVVPVNPVPRICTV